MQLPFSLAVGGTRRFPADLAVAHVLAHLLAGPLARIAISAAAGRLDDQAVALVQGRGRLGRGDLLAAIGTPDDRTGLGALRPAVDTGGAEEVALAAMGERHLDVTDLVFAPHTDAAADPAVPGGMLP